MFTMNIFLSGKPGCGKSTVLMKIIELLKQKGLKVRGFVTPEIRKGSKRLGFSVKDVYSGEEGTLASVELKTGPRLGKYRVDVESFERVALNALDFAVKECDFCCIDELGKMEFFSKKFKEKIYEILNSDKKVIACLHRNFVGEFRKYGKVIEVITENRDKLPEEIAEELSGPEQN